MRRTATALALALLTATLAGGCTSSSWKFVRQRPNESATTRVTVTSVPAGAEVLLNGDYMGVTPFVVPIKHTCEVRLYERRKLLPYLQVEAKELRTWVGNRFTFRFHLPGYADATREIELTGEEATELNVDLTPE